MGGPADHFEHGQFNRICDRCGRKRKVRDTQEEWTGLIVCVDGCWEERHPQDFVKGRVDRQTVEKPRPDATPLFVAYNPPWWPDHVVKPQLAQIMLAGQLPAVAITPLIATPHPLMVSVILTSRSVTMAAAASPHPATASVVLASKVPVVMPRPAVASVVLASKVPVVMPRPAVASVVLASKAPVVSPRPAVASVVLASRAPTVTIAASFPRPAVASVVLASKAPVVSPRPAVASVVLASKAPVVSPRPAVASVVLASKAPVVPLRPAVASVVLASRAPTVTTGGAGATLRQFMLARYGRVDTNATRQHALARYGFINEVG